MLEPEKRISRRDADARKARPPSMTMARPVTKSNAGE
jgi:hypothetical protein